VSCGFVVACAAATDICDPWTHRCLPDSGDCSAHGCPTFDPIQTIASIDCEGSAQLCRTHLRPIRITELPSNDIPITSPEPGQVVAPGQDLVVSWDATRNPVIVNVFDQLPASTSTLAPFADHAIWGGVSLPSHAPRLAWGDGFAIRNNVWQAGPPSRPADGAYYLLITSIDQEQVIAASALVAFWVGAHPSWPEPGALCSDALAIPGTCDNPVSPQACRDGRCYRLCSSDADCPDTVCEHTNADGFRVCAL
jgi:hypothetical protein